MKLWNQIVTVNICLLGALVFQHFLGARTPIIVGTGIFLFLLVNLIFFIRLRRSKTLH